MSDKAISRCRWVLGGAACLSLFVIMVENLLYLAEDWWLYQFAFAGLCGAGWWILGRRARWKSVR